MLTPSQLKIISTFNNLHQKITMNTFDDRLKFQKEVYLIQEFGVSYGYPFGWYRRGPYSSSAADDGFKLEAIQAKIDETPSLSPNERTSIERYQDVMRTAEITFRDLDKPDILELVASLHFILNKGFPKPRNNHEAVQTLIERKPRFQQIEHQIIQFLENTNLRQ